MENKFKPLYQFVPVLSDFLYRSTDVDPDMEEYDVVDDDDVDDDVPVIDE